MNSKPFDRRGCNSSRQNRKNQFTTETTTAKPRVVRLWCYSSQLNDNKEGEVCFKTDLYTEIFAPIGWCPDFIFRTEEKDLTKLVPPFHDSVTREKEILNFKLVPKVFLFFFLLLSVFI